MSAICIRLQSAFVRLILTESTREQAVAHSFGLATTAENVRVIATGPRQTIETNLFDLNVYAGVTTEQVAIPAAIVACQSATSDPTAPGVYDCDVTISLEYPADDSVDIPGVVEALDGAGSWLCDLLSDTNYVEACLEQCDPDLFISAMHSQTIRRGVDAEKRVKFTQVDFKVVASI